MRISKITITFPNAPSTTPSIDVDIVDVEGAAVVFDPATVHKLTVAASELQIQVTERSNLPVAGISTAPIEPKLFNIYWDVMSFNTKIFNGTSFVPLSVSPKIGL